MASKSIEQYEQTLLTLLSEKGPMTSEAIAPHLGLGLARTRTILSLMRQEGRVTFSRKGDIWFTEEDS